jgi:hypothetical protein
MQVANYITAGFAFLSTVILGLIGWGLRAQIDLLRSEFHLALSNSEVRFFQLVNGTYVRKEMMDLRLAHCPICQAQRMERVEKAA